MWRGNVSRRKFGDRGYPAKRESKPTRSWLSSETHLEPMLQRELEHRGLDKVNRGFEAKLIAWVEVVSSH